MKIVDVEALVIGEPPERIAAHSWDGSQDTVVVRITTDTGIVGIGETDSPPTVVKAVVDAHGSQKASWGLRDLLLGEDPREVARLWDLLYRGTVYYGRDGVAMHAIGAAELALWDVAGQALGQPVWRLLGGAYRRSVPVYASLITPPDPAATADAVRELGAQGFRAFKLGGGPLGADPDTDEAVVAAARAAAPRAQLMIDLAYCWESPSHALAMARRLARYDLRWIEEPLWPADVDAYEWLAQRSPVPIAAGEAESAEVRLLELVARRAVHVLQPDVTRVGGLLAAQRVVRAARDAGVDCVLHCWKTGIAKAATLHLSAASRNLTLMEYCVAENPIQAGLTVETFPVADGHVQVPTAPGLGVRLDDEVAAAYRWPPASDGRRSEPALAALGGTEPTP